jgi:DNA-binding transcriptional MerR regulator
MIKRSFTLKDIEQITGIQTNRLRIWKKRYGILEPQRTEGKTHYFSPQTLRFIMKVAKLLDQGYRISEVLEMSESELEDQLTSLIQQSNGAYREKLRDDILQAVLELEHRRLQQYYSTALERFGFRRTVRELLLPLLRTLGSLWEIGTIHSVHEHLFSHFIRQKLMVSADHLEPDTEKPETVLFLPDQDLHDITLLYINYHLLEIRQNPVYLGASVPYPDLEDYLEKRKPANAIGYLTYMGNLDFHVQHFPELIKKFPEIDFHFGIPPDYYDEFNAAIGGEKYNNLTLYKEHDALINAITAD